MDKYEYRIRAEEINSLIEQQQYTEAVKIADTIDWRRVRSSAMLCKISELYKMNRRYEDSKEVLLLAYDQHPQSGIYRKIIYSLCELSIKLEEIVQAVEYYKEFVQVAPRDTGRYILQYRLYEAQDVSLEERIAVLEEYKKRDYREKWAYELAYLYHRIGLATRCIEECDEMILWFGEGKYVLKAMELKMLHAPLTLQQQEKYNARFLSEMEAIAAVEEESLAQQEVEPSMPIEIKSIEVTKAKTARIPSKEIQEQTPEDAMQQTRRISAVKIEDEEESEDPTLDELVALVDEIGDPDANETDEEIMEVEEEEKVSEEVSEEEDEDADMKIVPPKDDLDIQVKTIDVGDQYSTINLQEALAKELAELFAKEDMEQVDATKALPVDTLEIASKLMEKQEENKLLKDETEEESKEDNTSQELEEDGLNEEDEEIEEITEAEGDVDDLTMLLPPMDLTLGQAEEEKADDEEVEKKEIEDQADTIEEDFDEAEEEVEAIAEEDFDEAEEEVEAIVEEDFDEAEEEAEAIVEEVFDETEEEVEAIAEEDFDEAEEEAEAIVEEVFDEAEEEAETIEEETIDVAEKEAEEKPSSQEESKEEEKDVLLQETKVIPAKEIVEAVNESKTEELVETEDTAVEVEEIQQEPKVEEEKTIAPPIYGNNNNVQMSEEMLEQLRQMTIEAAKQAAIEAAAQAAKQAAEQAAAQAAMQAAKETANVMQIQSAMPETSSVENTAETEKIASQPEVEQEPVIQSKEESITTPAPIEDKEEPEEDKQVTGQLSFADIMGEWEKTKKENEEKHIEEMKQKVLDQTGPLYPDDAKALVSSQEELSMISPMLDVFTETEELAEKVEQAFIEDTKEAEESSKNPIDTTAIAGIDQTVAEVEDKEENPVENVSVENTSVEEEKTEEIVEETKEEEIKTAVFNTEEINGLEEKLMDSLSNQHYETANIQIEALSEELAEKEEKQETEEEKPQENVEEISNEETVAEPEVKEEKSVEEKTIEASESTQETEITEEARTLTKEEKDLFGSIAQTKELQQKLAMALDAISMNPTSGNVIVTAEEGVGAIDIAKQIPTYLAQKNSHFNGKVSVFTFEDLKSKDIIATLDEHANGAMIINHAGQLSQQAIITITNAMKGMTDKGVLVILVDTKGGIERLKAVFTRLTEIFTIELNINSLDIKGLIKFGKEYARQLEYSIDAMGELALNKRIEEKQTNDHAVTIDEVKEIVNSAIEKAEKKSFSNFMGIVFAKKYDKDSLVVLREKDFLVDEK